MKRIILILLFLICFPKSVSAEPPFWNSSEIGYNIITEDDVVVAHDVVYEGRFDGETYDMFLFTVTYEDWHRIEFWVNPEFGEKATAEEQVSFYALMIGQLPRVLRSGIDLVTLRKGEEIWNAGCNAFTGVGNMVIYPEIRREDNTHALQETLIHEAGHASLDCLYRFTEEWHLAVEADGNFISGYGQSPSEQITEAFFAYLALSTRRDRIGEETAQIIEGTIPTQLAFFRSKGLDVHPFEYAFQITAGHSGSWYDPATTGQGFFLEVLPESEQIFLGWYTFDMERPSIASGVMGDSGQRWMTALGPYEGDTATLTVYQTEGGVFDAENPEPITDPKGDGTITLEFESCTKGFVHYEIDSTGASGSIPIERIANDNAELCEAMVARDGQVPK